MLHSGRGFGFQVLLDSLHLVRGRPGGLLQLSSIAQCGRTGRNAVLGQLLTRVVAWLSVSPRHCAHHLILNSFCKQNIWWRASIFI